MRCKVDSGCVCACVRVRVYARVGVSGILLSDIHSCYISTYLFIHECMYVCVCVCVRERE